MASMSEALVQIDELLSQSRQMWLLGAGISKNAGVPLMVPLTDRIAEQLEGDISDDFETLREELEEGSHVEHVLTQLGNLIEIAENRQDSQVAFQDGHRTVDELNQLHEAVQERLRLIIRWGYRPSENGEPPVVGGPDNPIISIDNHAAFVRSIFQVRRAGLESRPPVALFTTNYDTLLEDALALQEIPTFDGFLGGSMAYWRPDVPDHSFLDPLESSKVFSAKLYKLHGSIDWYATDRDVVVRRREGVQYPPEDKRRLLVYPQSTKYLTTQVEPFFHLFQAFRSALSSTSEGILGVCGYGFGDRHINREISRAFQQSSNQLTLIAFVREVDTDEPGDDGPHLPGPLSDWLCGPSSWNERVIVVTNRGIYHGSLSNKLEDLGEEELDLWTFEGLTDFLLTGPHALESEDV